MSTEQVTRQVTEQVELFKKTYSGFEDAADLERDISEMYEYCDYDLPGDFRVICFNGFIGDMVVKVYYIPPEG